MSPRIKEFVNRGAMPLVGRERELRLLLDAFASLLEGEPRAVWMSGIAGVGKSRLLDELKTRARDHSSRSLVVHAKWYEGEGVELGPLTNGLEVVRPALAAPVASRIFRDGSLVTVDAAVEAIQIASRRYPVVLILDDLHHLRSSAELGRFVAALEEIPILLVATTRPSDNPALRSLRQALAGSIPPFELEIGPLDGSGIAEAAEALFGAAPPEEIVGQIAALSAGVPLALREALRELISAGHVVPGVDANDPWTFTTDRLDDEEMRTIGDLVHGFTGRLASLAPTERRLLAMAACLGEQFNRDLLRNLGERTVGWDEHAFEALIVGGFIAVATPSIRLGVRESEGRVCYAFMHTLLWKATAAAKVEGMPAARELAGQILDILTSGIGELYGVAPLEGVSMSELDDERLARLFGWLVAVSQKLSPINSESFVTLWGSIAEPVRSSRSAETLAGELGRQYLAALTAYGERLYLTGARDQLHGVAVEIASMLAGISTTPPATDAERVGRLEAAVVVWHDALLHGATEAPRGVLEHLLSLLPSPPEQSDRELRAATEAIGLLASHRVNQREFAGMLDLAAPYIGELDRMRPEALNALLKALLYAMMSEGRMDEAGEMVAAALRVRGKADLFTEYELLNHAANYGKSVGDLESVRRYGSEARQLVDRYPAFRNLSSNYYQLVWVAAAEGRADELEALETQFRSSPPPARSSPLQTAIARQQFQIAWNRLGNHERAVGFANELAGELETLPPRQRLNIAIEEVRSFVDAADRARLDVSCSRLEAICRQLGVAYDSSVPGIERELEQLLVLTRAVEVAEPEELRERIATWATDDATDGFRAAQLLLGAADRSTGRKREYNDAAYTAIELSIAAAVAHSWNGLAHHRLELLSERLPKTRLARFKQMAGADSRQAPAPQSAGSAGQTRTAGQGRMLRTFGALTIEAGEETGAKLESKTRTLVAALVVARIGESRSLGELTRDRLADLLWPDMSIDRAVNNLHATLSYARRFLGGAETILQQDGVYSLSDEVRIDAVEFRECSERGDRLHAEGIYFGAAAAYRSAATLADGDFLEGMYAEWIDNARESLRGELATALERLIALEIDRENYPAIPSLADRLLGLDDLHDGAYEALIRSAAARGARREAFNYFKRYETALDSYGAGPARRITELMAKVKAGEV